MARAFRVTFSSAAVEATPSPTGFEVATVPGGIALRGNLTAVGGDWALSAVALCRRRTIVLYIAAKEEGESEPPRMRDYQYDATVHEIPPGRYSLQVAHVYSLARVVSSGLAVRKFERQLVVS